MKRIDCLPGAMSAEMTYVLHFAPDNASLIVRLALDHAGLPYQTRLVDRAARAQETAAYRALNPNGLIPTLETPHGVLFETGAILLWLADTHGGLGPAPDDPGRGNWLKWLFFVANTVHPALSTPTAVGSTCPATPRCTPPACASKPCPPVPC